MTDNESFEQLVDLKFLVEREINLYSELSKKLYDMNIDSSNEKGKSRDNIMKKYKNNINNAKTHIDSQYVLLKLINDDLYENCSHEWIYDTVEDGFREKDICYCSKCFCKK